MDTVQERRNPVLGKAGLSGSAAPLPFTAGLSWWIGDAIGSLVTVPLLALAALPVLSSLLAQSIFRSAELTGSALDVLQRMQQLISLNQLLFVFLGVGLVIQSSSWLLARDRAREQAEAASRVAGSVVHEIAQPLLRLKVQLERLRSELTALAMNALRLDGYWSITEGLAALAHDIRGLLALLGWREPAQALNSA